MTGSVSSAVSVKAVTATKFLSVSDTRALYGDHITAQYRSGGSYANCTFNYMGYSTTTSAGLTGIVPSGDTAFTNWQFLYYNTNMPNLDISPDNVTVYLNPEYSIIDTENISTFVAITTYQNVSDTVYDASAWDYRTSVFGQDTAYGVKSGSDYAISGFVPTNIFSGSPSGLLVVPIDISHTSKMDFSSSEVRFRGVKQASNGYNSVYLVIGCPRVDDDSATSSGTITTTEITSTSAAASVTVNVNVSVDNSDVISAVNAQGAEQSAAASAQQSQDAAYQESMLHGSTVQTQTIATIDESALSAAMTADIYDDLPEMIATAGFWLALLGHILKLVPFFSAFLAGFLCLNLLIYIIWRK